MHVRTLWALVAAVVSCCVLLPTPAWASGGAHGATASLLTIAVILLAAKLGSHVAARLSLPAVLGELLVGVALGNLALLGWHGLDAAIDDPQVTFLAELGVILLLFEVGLESTVGQMLRVGPSALAVGVTGVIAPMVLGALASAALMPESSLYVHVFVGAALSATSVGITARVLKDLRRSDSAEARVILGAAVIDDVLGLVVLAAVSGLIASADAGLPLTAGPVVWLALKAVLFLGGSVVIGRALTPLVFRQAARLQSADTLLAVGLALCFGTAWLASVAELAPIVGAFAAGLVLEQVHFKSFVDRGEHGLEELIKPLTGFLAPIFFVSMGMRVDLKTLADPSVLALAGVLTAVAVAGKLLAGFAVLDRSVRRLPVSVGMIPRGEVGLIFANIGLGLSLGGVPIVSASLYSALVVMVIVTTLITPPWLARTLGAGEATPEA
jgi:Kef-type K+ transport system membrane component KefB